MSSDYVLNIWYMAAWQEEVDAVEMLSRELLDQRWVIFRRADGSYAMLRDRCPHRFAPLSKGKRIGDTIACGYHGLQFNSGGTCIHNPFSQQIPPNAVVKTLPMVARYGILWFWPGDPASCDPDRIPDFAFLDDPQPMTRKHTEMSANFEILTDNLMDLSHIEFVHEHSFQSGGALLTGTYKARHDSEGTIWSCWFIEDVSPPRFAAAQLGNRSADRWSNMRWNAPASMYLEICAAPHGTPADESPVKPLRNPHIITPATPDRSHYFYNCFPGAESEAFAKLVFEDEDRPMLEAVQEAMGDQDFWEMKPAILNVDAGAIRARRALGTMRKVEQDQSAA